MYRNPIIDSAGRFVTMTIGVSPVTFMDVTFSQFVPSRLRSKVITGGLVDVTARIVISRVGCSL